MGAFDWFWKAMGSQSERNDKKSKAIVDEARSAAEKLAQSDDAAVAQAARDAVRGGEVADKAQFRRVRTHPGFAPVYRAIAGGTATAYRRCHSNGYR